MDVCLECARHGVLLDAGRLSGVLLPTADGGAVAPDAALSQGSLDAMRLLAAAKTSAADDLGVVRRLAKALFKVRWTSSSAEDLDPDHLAMLSAAFGVSGAFLSTRKTQSADAQLEANAQAAFSVASAPGVPCFHLIGPGRGKSPIIFFGHDRLALLDARIRAELRGSVLPYPSPLLLDVSSAAELVRRNRWSIGGQAPRVEFFLDLVSPWSYLAQDEILTHISSLCRLLGITEGVTPRPVLLGALFKQIGTQSVPGAKVDNVNLRRYGMGRDFSDWARHRGLHAKFKPNSKFPFKSSVANRVCCAEPKVCPALFKAAWEQDVDLGDETAVERVLVSDAGFTPQAAKDLVLRGKSDPELRRQLEANTADAAKSGICGAPALRISGARGISQVWDELTSQVPPLTGAHRAWRLDAQKFAGLEASRDRGAVTFWGNDRLDAFVWFLVSLARYNAADGKGDGLALWDEQKLVHSFAVTSAAGEDMPLSRL